MHENDVRSRLVLKGSDIYGVYQLCTTGSGAVVDGGDPPMKPFGWKLVLTVVLLVKCCGLVLGRGCKGTGDCGGDGTLLGVMSSRTRGDAMAEVVVKLGGNGFHCLICGERVGRIVGKATCRVIGDGVSSGIV